MKNFTKLFVMILASAAAMVHAGENVLDNADFSQKSAGRFTKWVPLNGTTLKQDEQGIVLANPKGGVVMIQHIRPRPAEIVNLSVEVMCPEADEVRTYVEHGFPKNGKTATASSGAIWHKAEAGKWITLKSDIILNKDYTSCYFVVGNKSGKTMYIRNPKVEVMYGEILRNTGFDIYRHGKLSYWFARGNSPQNIVFGKDGVAKVADAFIIQTGLPVISGETYEVTYEVRGEAGSNYRVYMEWWYTNASGKRLCATKSTGWKPAPAEWTKGSLTVPTTLNIDHAYAVFGAKDAKGVEFRNLKIKLVEKKSE